MIPLFRTSEMQKPRFAWIWIPYIIINIAPEVRTPHYSVKETGFSVPLIPGVYKIHSMMRMLTSPLSHLRAPYPTVSPIPLYHGTDGTFHGGPLSHLRAPYPTFRPIPLYHGTGGTVHGSPLSHLRAPHPSVRPIQDRWDCLRESTVPSESPISQCPSYPTVSWDRWDCPWESTVPPEGPHTPLSVLSHCTMGQVGLSIGVHCPSIRAPISHSLSYPTV